MNTDPVVYIVDDDQAFAESLTALVTSMRLTARWFSTPDDYLAQFNPDATGCLILDVRMPKMSGLALQEQLARLPLAPSIIIVTAFADVPTALRAMRLGAVDFLEKTFSQSELFDAIHRAIAHDVQRRAAYRRKQDLDARFAQLSGDERQVLMQVLEGAPNKQIATRLQVSRRTVEDRRARLMRKLKVEALADLVRLAHEARIIEV